jgi:hypothetical protein
MWATSPSPKKVEARPARAVEELIGEDEIERPMLFLERADRAERNNALDAQRFHGVDVGAEVQLRGRDAMPAPVPRQKRHLAPGQRSHHELSDGAPNGVSIAASRSAAKPGIE